MPRRKGKIPPLSVTSFRLPTDVHAFLLKQSEERDRPMSYILTEVLRMYMNYLEALQKQPPKVKTDD